MLAASLSAETVQVCGRKVGKQTEPALLEVDLMPESTTTS